MVERGLLFDHVTLDEFKVPYNKRVSRDEFLPSLPSPLLLVYKSCLFVMRMIAVRTTLSFI